MRFLLRELSRHWRFGVQFVAILALGLTGFLLVEALRKSVEHSLESQSRSMLAGDLAVSRRFPFTPEEASRLKQAIGQRPFSRTVEFFTMVAKKENAKLVLVKAVDSNYPLAGELRTNPEASKEGIRASPEVLTELSAALGDTLKIGQREFSLSAEITDDPTQSFRAFALGGRVYLPMEDLPATKLLQAGSTATYTYLIVTKSDAEALALKKELKRNFPDSEVRVTTAKEAGENATRALAYMGDFLGLVSLIALLLSSLGAAYLFRSHLEARKQEVAIYRALGFTLRALQAHSLAQTVFLSLLALMPAAALAASLLPLLEKMIATWSNISLGVSLHPEAFLPLLLLCVLGAPLVLLPEFLVLRHFTPLELFREQAREARHRPFLHYLPSLLLFAALAPLVARSWRNAGIFLGLLALLVLGLLVVLRIFSLLLPRLRPRSWHTRHALLFLSRKKRATAAVFLTLSVGSLLLHILPQLEASMRAELEAPTRLPSLFLFDIQDEQKARLEEKLASIGHRLLSVSPLVRARITAVNSKAFEQSTESTSFKTREEEQDARFRNRGVNLSYRESLQDSETLVSGVPFAGNWDAGSSRLPEISVEARFADRLQLRLGDVLKFDVQGVEVEGKIVNTRRVRWTSFQPNFFLLFENGVLQEAPKTFLAGLGALSAEKKLEVQSVLAREFPNISVVDVASAITRILELLSRMRLALLLLAALALTAGFAVLVSVLRLEAQERATSLVLYRALGASGRDLQSMLLQEGFIVSVLAITLGSLGSIAFTYGLARFVFDGAFQVAAGPLVALSAFLLGVSFMVSWFAGRSLVARPPLEILRESR